MAYIPEVTFGTTPATPQMVLIPMQSTTLDFSKDIIQDPTLVADRMKREAKHGNIATGGNIVVTLQHGQFDDLLEAALCGTWATNTIKSGTVTRSFTVEEGFLDVTEYRRFTGVKVNSLELSLAPNQVVQATFGLIGQGMTTAIIPLDSTPTALQAKVGLTHLGGTITVGGTSVVATSLTLSLQNGYTANYGIGSATARDITYSDATLTGSVTFYFEDLVQYNRFVNETTAAIVCSTTDGTNTLTFTIPKAKFNGGQLPVPNSGVLFLTMPFEAFYDSVSGTTISITRS
jgi:hypothetical protein